MLTLRNLPIYGNIIIFHAHKNNILEYNPDTLPSAFVPVVREVFVNDVNYFVTYNDLF